uniref:Glycosyl transferase 48 domain-containing protein n=1 Tax=Quercus lobata TaxID=97700 RepID=A0A7N2LM17_QUELO
MGRVGSVWTHLGPNLPALGGRRRDPKSIAGVNRLSWFRVRVMLGLVERVARSCKRCRNLKKLCRNLQKLCQNLQKLTPFAPEITEISLDLLESRRISPNMVEISSKSAWISSNLVGYHQIWLRSRRNQLGSPRISLDLTKYGRNPSLCVAYIDEVLDGKGRHGKKICYSVLVKAIGNVDQLDNYLEEVLKMRNLLEEFKKDHGIRLHTILGVREHIFIESISSLAWFMSVQDRNFVSIV